MRQTLSAVFLILSFLLCAFIAGSLVGGSPDLSPEWTVSRPNVSVSSCNIAVQRVAVPQARIIEDYTEADLTRSEAEEIADRAFKKLWGDARDPVYEGTFLLRATLPDNEERLVWARIWIADSMGRRSEVLYLDADSGDVLVHYTDFNVITPPSASGCFYNYAYDFEQSFENPTAIAVGIAGLAAPLLLGAFFLWRRYQRAA